jgi:hypothetical protein
MACSVLVSMTTKAMLVVTGVQSDDDAVVRGSHCVQHQVFRFNLCG